MSSTEVRDELEALRKGVSDRHDSASATTADHEEPQSLRDEIEQTLQQLRRCLADIADEAEGSVIEHPAISLTAAFVLGVVIGRLSGVGK